MWRGRCWYVSSCARERKANLTHAHAQADDTTIAPRFNMPCLVSMEDLQTFYTREGVELPNTDTRRIGTDLQRILQSTFVTHDTLTDALLTTGLWVCVVQRKFAFLSTGRSPFMCTSHVFTILPSRTVDD